MLVVIAGRRRRRRSHPIPVLGIGFANPLPFAADHIAAVAVFGNPSAKIGAANLESGVRRPAIDIRATRRSDLRQRRQQRLWPPQLRTGRQRNQAAVFVANRLSDAGFQGRRRCEHFMRCFRGCRVRSWTVSAGCQRRRLHRPRVPGRRFGVCPRHE